MSNRVFNVNGRGEETLLRVLKLAFEHDDAKTCQHWSVDPKYGFILHSYSGGNRLPAPCGVEAMHRMIVDWLASEEAKTIELQEWDQDCDHDGSNSPGWRVYVGDWGRVGEIDAICVVTPAYLWHGK